jgi:cellulose synthase/poly-beta-1,6-N-acetylglucosamine synthase-like glycosyltransferase/peptidoglycan/xylan/chitin deacetylase (PgdA/CDA1 family)
MQRSRMPRGGPVRVDRTGRPVFLNPSGARWKYIRAVLLVGAAAVVAFAAVVLPQVVAPPALDGAPVPDAPTADELGHPPVTGTGPLTRIVRLIRADGAVYGQDPFDGQVVGQLSARDARKAHDAPYAVQRYGYSATAHRTISLTFDDGPSAEWTPRLLDLLSRYHVPATFFVTGEQMAKHPDIMRRIQREGFALGNHTLTHTDMNTATSFRQQAELALADRIMRAETGHYGSYFRLPYEGDDEESISADAPGILRAQQLGYVVASHDFDTLDWAHADGERTGEIPLPPLDGRMDNMTLLLHDGGGHSRALTLDYVKRLIIAARDAGYTFHSMPQVQPDIAARVGPAPVTLADRVALHLAQVLFVLPGGLLFGLFVLALVTMLGLGVLYTVLALVRARLRRRRPPVPAGDLPAVAVLIAAYNEELVIARTLEHVLASANPITEVVVVDDGSTDGTAGMVRAVAAGDPRVRLVRQANAGKWAALNRGFAEITADIVVTLDADTLFTPDTVAHLVAEFRSPQIGAVAGVIKVGNHARNVVTRWQALEYVTQIGLERSASALLDAVMVIPGACAAWRREAVLQAGGYSNATLAEDCDLTLMLHQHGWRVAQADHAIAYTEAPETVDALLKQRVRWMYGTLQAIWRHRSMLLRPRFGWLGMLVMPMAAVTLLVPLVFTPLIAVVLVQMLLDQGLLHVLAYFGMFSLIYGALAAVAVVLMRERPAHLLMVPLYRVIYEPLRAYLLYASLGTALRGIRLGWNKLARTAHMDEVTDIAAAERPAAVQPSASPVVPARVPQPAVPQPAGAQA